MTPLRRLLLILVILLVVDAAICLGFGAITDAGNPVAVGITIYLVSASLLIYEYRARRTRDS